MATLIYTEMIVAVTLTNEGSSISPTLHCLRQFLRPFPNSLADRTLRHKLRTTISNSPIEAAKEQTLSEFENPSFCSKNILVYEAYLELTQVSTFQNKYLSAA